MKTRTYLSITIFISLILSCSGQRPEQWEMVSAASGLNLRTAPSPDAKRIVALPRLALVRVLEQDSVRKTVAGRKGFWKKVRWQGKTGWTFGAFLGRPEKILAGKKFLRRSESESGDTLYYRRLRFLRNGMVSMETVYDAIPAIVKNVSETLNGTFRISGDTILLHFTSGGSRISRRRDDGGEMVTSERMRVDRKISFLPANRGLKNNNPIRSFTSANRKYVPPVMRAATPAGSIWVPEK